MAIKITDANGTQVLVAGKGKDATINGVNTLTIQAGDNVELTQEGNVLTISVTGAVPAIVPQSLSITTPPTKTAYHSGESFDPTGMVVTCTYSNNSTAEVTGYSWTPDGPLSAGTTSVKIIYTESGVTLEAEQAITVETVLTGLAVTTPPTKTSYELGESFAPAGMVVTASYSDGSSKAVTGYTTAPTSFNTLGSQTVTVTYTEKGITKTATTTVTVERITIATVPSQQGTLTYKGSAQTVTLANYDENKMTLGGATSGTNAGSYTATVTPKANYRWVDGTTDAKDVVWSIGKADGYLSLDQTSLNLTSSNKYEYITAFRSGDGKISAFSNNTNVAVVEKAGDGGGGGANRSTYSNAEPLLVTAVGNGNATITISVGEGTNYTAPAPQMVSVNVSGFLPAKKALNETSWADISTISQAGQGANYWAVGDCKAVAMNGTVSSLTLNTTLCAYILDFNHDKSSAQGTADGITFGTWKSAVSGGKDLALVSGYSDNSDFRMNKTDINTGGWKGCDMRYNILGSTKVSNGDAGTDTATSPKANTLMSCLPSDLRSVMRPMYIYTDNVGGRTDTASNVSGTLDYLPLMAEFEVFGTITGANSAEQNYQKQYAYYSAGNSKIKYQHTNTGSAVNWWLRSPSTSSSYYFRNVNGNGTSVNRYADNSLGVAPAFKV